MALKIKHKVILPALAVILVLLAPASYSAYSIFQINFRTRQLSTYDFPGSLATGNMRRSLDDLILQGLLAVTQTGPEDSQQKFDVAREELDKELARLMEREPSGAEPVHRRFRQARDRLYAALQSWRPDDHEAFDEAKLEAYERLRELEEHYTRKVQDRISEVASIGNFAAQFTLSALLAGLVLSAVVWVAILLNLSRPLRELVAGTERVAQGRFVEPIPVLARDELGTLSDAFNRMAASLSELDRMKAEFVATASHELKTPLACIKGFASLLRSGSRGPLTEEQRTTLQQVEEQVDQMTSFVVQLLDLSRLRAGRLAMNTRSLPAEAFFGSVARGFEGVAERKGIRYRVQLSRSLPQRIHVDPDRMREVVYNLLGNAFKFTEAGGEVAFEAEADGAWVRVTVSDTGPGVPQEEIPYIFEKYYRGAETDGGHQNEGAGLGLAISRGIVEKHGGRLWVENRAGRGSRFIFRFPASGTRQTEQTHQGRRTAGTKET